MNEIYLEKNSIIKKVPVGFSWTMLLFGFFVPLFRNDLKWTIIMFVATICSACLVMLIFPFFYNKIYLQYLLENGWKAYNETSDTYLKMNNFIVNNPKV